MKPTILFKNLGVDREAPHTRQQFNMNPDFLAESEGVNVQEQVQQLPQLQKLQADVDDIEQEYKDAVKAAVANKEMQAEYLENRLESLIDKQEAVLQQMMSRKPGFLTLPGQKAKWQTQIQQLQSLLSRLHNRLETVKEIHDGMGVHGSRIHELATAKVRHEKPELAAGWDDIRSAQRAHENLMRKLAKEQKTKQERELALSISKGRFLSLTRTIT